MPQNAIFTHDLFLMLELEVSMESKPLVTDPFLSSENQQPRKSPWDTLSQVAVQSGLCGVGVIQPRSHTESHEHVLGSSKFRSNVPLIFALIEFTYCFSDVLSSGVLTPVHTVEVGFSLLRVRDAAKYQVGATGSSRVNWNVQGGQARQEVTSQHAQSWGVSPGTAVAIVTWVPEVCGHNGGFVAFIADLFRDMVGAPALLRLSWDASGPCVVHTKQGLNACWRLWGRCWRNGTVGSSWLESRDSMWYFIGKSKAAGESNGVALRYLSDKCFCFNHWSIATLLSRTWILWHLWRPS